MKKKSLTLQVMGQDVDLDLVLIERFEKNRNCKMHVPYTFLKSERRDREAAAPCHICK